MVSLSASAETLLPNDEVVVQYHIEATGLIPVVLQREVNAVAGKVGKVLDGQKGLSRQTTGRRLQPMSHYDKARGRQVSDGWRMVQGERVTSRRLDAVPAWVDGIEKAGAHLDGLDFEVSDQAAEAAMQKLRMQAVTRFRQRAATLAKALDAPSFIILKLNSDNRPPIVPMQRGVMALSAERAQPVLNVGKSRFQVTVSGDILLPQRLFNVKRTAP